MRRATGFALLALVALSASGCFRPPREPLRIGVNAWPPFELLALARSRGFFEQERVQVDLIDFSSYTGILRAYHQGNIDAFLATLNEVQIADNFQDQPSVVLVADYSYGGDALVVSDGIRTLKALRGRRVAYEESALGSYALERILEVGGLEVGAVEAVSRLPEEAERDFRKGLVDGVIAYEPGLGRLLRRPGARVLFSSRDLPGEIVDVLAVRPAVLNGRGDEVRSALRAWFRAVALLNADPPAAASEMAARLHVGADEVLQGLRGARIPDLAENRELLGKNGAPGRLRQTADRLAEFLTRRGLRRRAADGPDLIRADFLDAPGS